MKERGSDGGHNGIADINDKIGREYPRLRIGIGNNFSRGRQVDYVLAPFGNEEIEDVNASIKKAHDAALAFVTMGIERAMNFLIKSSPFGGITNLTIANYAEHNLFYTCCGVIALLFTFLKSSG